MPAGDRTGPDGMGPTTGRAAGVCAGYNAPGYMNPAVGGGCGFGFGRGRRLAGRGRGRGFGRRLAYPYAGVPNAVPYNAPANSVPTREEDLDALKEQQQYLDNALQDVRRRIDKVESKE